MATSNSGKFGAELMRLVASKLRLKRDLVNNHRDYCGYGLFYRDTRYLMAIVHDGLFEDSQIVHAWDTTKDFIAFFTPLTDFKCSGKAKSTNDLFAKGPADNQRITRARLKEFLGEYSLCPFCNEVLYTPRTKQCPHCKESWFEKA